MTIQPPDDYDTSLCWPPMWIVTNDSNRNVWGCNTVFGTEVAAHAHALSLNIRTGFIANRPQCFVRSATHFEREIAIHYDCVVGIGTEGHASVKPHGQHPVWVNEPWWRAARNIHETHWLRRPEDRPLMLSYFAKPRDAMLGRRTITTPGRYLTKYFSDTLPEKEIAMLAKWQVTGVADNPYMEAEKYPILFANTANGMEEVYVYGPHSCMSYDAEEEDSSEFKTGIHPVRMYAAGDLAIAYIANPDFDMHEDFCTQPPKYLARSLCWPAKKVFARVYPTTNQHNTDRLTPRQSEALQNALRNRLLADGWTSITSDARALNGAKLRVLKDDESWKYVVPYLDHDLQVRFTEGQKYLEICTSGGVRADATDGLLDMSDPDNDDQDDMYMVCDACGMGVSSVETVCTDLSDEAIPEGWVDLCIDCRERRQVFFCEGVRVPMEGVSIDRVQVMSDPTNGGEITTSRQWADVNSFISAHNGQRYRTGAFVFFTLSDGRPVEASAVDEHVVVIDGRRYLKTELPLSVG